MYGALLFVLSILLMLVEVPVGLSLFISGSIGLLLSAGIKSWWCSLMFSVQPVTTNSTYLVIPLFLLMGQIAAKSSINSTLVNTSRALFRNSKSGAGIASIITAAMFGSICGSSIATIASLGPIFYKTMSENRYSKELIFGIIAAGGTLGILIPPSIVLVVYGIATQESIGKLFIAAIPPSLIAVSGYIIAVLLFIKNNKEAITNPDNNMNLSQNIESNNTQANINEVDIGNTNKTNITNIQTNNVNQKYSYKSILYILTCFFLALSGMYNDIISPAECASIIVTLMLFYQFFVDKCLDKKVWFEIFDSASKSTGMIILIFIGANVFNSALASAGFPREFAEFISLYKDYPTAIILSIALIFLFLGCIMDGLAMVLLFSPLLYPVITSLDLPMPHEYIGIWFGVLMLMLVEVSLITPPVGMNLFVIKHSIKELRNVNVVKAVKYFLISDLIRILILIFLPQITLIFLA